MSAPAITIPGTAGGGVPVGGSGATGYVAKWTAATTLGGSATSGANASPFIDATGNVGIGTASPSARLHVATGTVPNLAGLYVGFGSATNYYDANTHIFRDGSATERMRIDATGNVGIGTASPTAALHLPAGTTARAALNLTTGVAPTAPNNGDIWFDGTNIQMRVGGVTKTFTLV